MPNGTLWAIEVKRGLSAKPGKGFFHAYDDLKPAKSFIVYSGDDRYPLAENVEAISVKEMALLLASEGSVD